MIVRLSNINKENLRQDVFKLVPNWNEGRDTRRLHPNMTIVEQEEDEEGNLVPAEHERVSGNRLDIIPIPDRVLQEPKWDEEGNLIQQKKLAGEYRVDISLPDEFELPELKTRVFPERPDHKIL
jgi:hypothetical protein